AWLAPCEHQYSALAICSSVPSSFRDPPHRYPHPPRELPDPGAHILPDPVTKPHSITGSFPTSSRLPITPLSPDPKSLNTLPCTPPHTHTPLLTASFSGSLSPPPPLPAVGPRSASLLSLQTELLLDLVAEAQSRRLEEQRATFHAPQKLPSLGRVPPRPLEDREQLYSTILSHQCQRMEAQRSEPPLPPGGQELLELLLRVQGGGRMEEQRSQPPTHTC
uniref:G-protein-signaling modulator 3 n=1 Tax=Sus scrofa TaxID=9823 RepID=A0A4X1V7T3_PIG